MSPGEIEYDGCCPDAAKFFRIQDGQAGGALGISSGKEFNLIGRPQCRNMGSFS